MDEFDALRREHKLTRQENHLLREFVAQGQLEQAVNVLLRRFVPNPERGFAALVERDSSGTRCEFRRGLADDSVASLRLSEAEYAIIQQARAITIEGRSIDDSSLICGLVPRDRAKIEQLHLVAVGDRRSPAGVFATTSLFPAGAPIAKQMSLAKRLMTGVGARLLAERSLRAREQELRLSSEMLDLRSVADQRYGNPVALIEAFLSALAPKLAADAAAIFLFARDGSTTGPAVARVGGPEIPGVLARWKQYEETLASLAVAVDRPRVISAAELPRYGIAALIGTVLLLPLRRDEQPVGVIALSWGKALLLTGMELSLASWSAEFLAHAIPRVLSQAVFERQARQDGLTGLANRREWDRQFALAIDDARRFGSPLSILLCDLDRFKSVNDLHGHRAGDEVLRAVARTFQDQVVRTRASDAALVARYGGEEIAVLLPGFEAVGALRIAEAIRFAVQETSVTSEDRQLRATISVGLASYPAHSDSAEGLIAGADLALYEAKMTGRNRICTAGPLAMTEPPPSVTPRRTVRTDPHLLK